MFDFDDFNGKGSHFGYPSVSHREGRFFFNPLSYEEMGSPNAVKLMIDIVNRVIGFKIVNKGVKGSYSMMPKKDRSCVVSSTTFTNRNKIGIFKGAELKKYDKIDNTWYVELEGIEG